MVVDCSCFEREDRQMFILRPRFEVSPIPLFMCDIDMAHTTLYDQDDSIILCSVFFLHSSPLTLKNQTKVYLASICSLLNVTTSKS